jgi:cell wall-associated NlpC family hydrolase
MTEGISAVLTRIQDIQGRIANLTGAPSAPTATPITTTSGVLGSGSTAQGFAGELASAIGDTTGTSAAGTLGATTGTSTAAGSGAVGQRVVDDAKRYLGVPYVWGGTDPATGLDCSGLVQQVFGDLGVKLPRVSRDQARMGTPVASVADAVPGDLVAFGNPVDHIGIYVGDGKMIAAPYPGKAVRIESLPSTPTAIRRIVNDGPAAFAAPSALGASPLSVSGLGGATAAATTNASGTTASGTPFGALFESASARNGLPSGLLAAVAKAESGFDPDVVSRAGAQGLMQLMPATAKGLGVNAFDPAQAIDGAARLLHSNLKEFGSVPLALAAYNAGAGAVHRYGGVPPYAETQSYVARVQKYQQELAA